MAHTKFHNIVVTLSAAGVLFILLGLAALALPATQEGVIILQLDGAHTLNSMDIVGMFAVGLGVVLTWLSGKCWTRQLRV
ncbi:MAG TPA: hypothetical protein PKH77_20130 [Anaerolineae bacterium]|nr:hypothetical protein [Anaerolineae bacterium]